MYDIAPCHNSKRTRTFLECNRIPILECPNEFHRERLEYNEKRDWYIVTKCRDLKMRCGSKYVKRGKV